MNRALLCFFFLLSQHLVFSQANALFVKRGYKKKVIFEEGDIAGFQLNDNGIYVGTITLLRNDTIFLDGRPLYRPLIKAVLIPHNKNRFPADATTVALITGGVALATAGLTLSKQASFKKAAIAGLVIGYAPLLAQYFGKGILSLFKRKKYRIGKKYRLQVFDISNPPGSLPSLRGF